MINALYFIQVVEGNGETSVAAVTTNVNGKPQVMTDLHGNTSLVVNGNGTLPPAASRPPPNGTVMINGNLYKEADPGVHMAIPAASGNPDLIPPQPPLSASGINGLNGNSTFSPVRSPMAHLRRGNGLAGHLASPSPVLGSRNNGVGSPHFLRQQQAVNAHNIVPTSPVPHQALTLDRAAHLVR